MLLHYIYIYYRTYTHLFACFLPKLSENKVHIEEKKDILLLGHNVYKYAKSISCVQPFAALWTVACQAPLSMGFTRQE